MLTKNQAVSVLVAVLAAIAGLQLGSQAHVPEPRLMPVGPFRSYGPDDLGVVCYQVNGGAATMSCVQIRPAQPPIKPAVPGNGVQS